MSHSAAWFLCAPVLAVGMAASIHAAPAIPDSNPANHRPAHSKYGAPVVLRFSVPDHLASNKPFDVVVEITPGIDAALLSLDWSVGPGLSLSGNAGSLQLVSVSRGMTYRRTIRLVAARDGSYRIGAVVSLIAGTARQSRAFAQRLQVGVPLAKAKPALTRDERGGLIEASPARETVSRR